MNGFLVVIDADWATPRRAALVSGHKGQGAAVIAHDGKESTTHMQAACEASSTRDASMVYKLVYHPRTPNKDTMNATTGSEGA